MRSLSPEPKATAIYRQNMKTTTLSAQKDSISAIYSDEPLHQPKDENCLAIGVAAGTHIGFGSAVMVTGSVGLRLASLAVTHILEN